MTILQQVSMSFEELGLVFCRNTLQSREDKTEVLPGLEGMCFWLHFPTGGWCRSCSVQHVPRGLFDNTLTYAAKNRVKCRKEVTEKASWGDLCVFNVCNRLLLMFHHTAVTCFIFMPLCVSGRSWWGEGGWEPFLNTRAVFTSVCWWVSRLQTFSYFILCFGELRELKLTNVLNFSQL